MAPDATAPALVAWFDAKYVKDENVAALLRAWRSLIENACDETLQATLTRVSGGMAWQLSPLQTLYEIVCGTDGAHVLDRQWASRWLRVPGNTLLWLGGSLSKQLSRPARAALDKIADVTARDDGLLVALRARADVSRYEQALAAVLPSNADAQKAGRAE
jgi:hypothetical protein